MTFELWQVVLIVVVLTVGGFISIGQVERQLMRDAARYRYLRRSWIYTNSQLHRLEWYLPRSRLPLPQQLDKHIDEAIRRG